MESKDLVKYFFEKLPEPVKMNNKTYTHRCKVCPDYYRNQSGSGYTNLLDHINRDHKDFDISLACPESNQPNIAAALTSAKGRWVFGWLDLIINENLPLSMVGSKHFRKYVKLESMAIRTFEKYMELVCKDVEIIVKSMLPKKFGIVFDGWTHGSTHYVAFYAAHSNSFGHPESNCSSCSLTLLSLTPILDSWYDLSAEAHGEKIKYVLSVYDRTLEDVLFVTCMFLCTH